MEGNFHQIINETSWSCKWTVLLKWCYAKLDGHLKWAVLWVL